MSYSFNIPVSAELLARAQAGRDDALAVIYRLFERPAFNLARRMTHCPDAAADVMQDAFMNVFKRMKQFRGEGSFGMWLRTVVASQALMYLRKQRRIFEIFTVEESGEHVGQEDGSTVDLERALGLLDELPRAVMWLYHVEGYTHPEIAEICGKSVSFSKSQLSRAHQKLRDLLAIDFSAKTGGQSSARERATCNSVFKTA